jgi:hypothetical protein
MQPAQKNRSISPQEHDMIDVIEDDTFVAAGVTPVTAFELDGERNLEQDREDDNGLLWMEALRKVEEDEDDSFYGNDYD